MKLFNINGLQKDLKYIVLSVCISFLSISCGPSDHAIKISNLAGDAVNGKVIYETKSSPSCMSCHGKTARGGSSGPNIKSAVSDEGEFIDFVLEGEGPMPAYDSQLTDQEIADLVSYVQSL
jgi:mono/diheme cytochrome c family protein